jgi:hypothetical protein
VVQKNDAVTFVINEISGVDEAIRYLKSVQPEAVESVGAPA